MRSEHSFASRFVSWFMSGGKTPMDEPFTVKTVVRDLSPSDILVLKADFNITHDQAERLHEYGKTIRSDGGNVVVLGKGMDIEVVKQAPKVVRKTSRGVRVAAS